jgi:hypothetical protein
MSFFLKSKLACRITTIYGASEDENKQYFIEELHNLLVGRSEATIIGGHFILVRFQDDKTNGRVDHR